MSLWLSANDLRDLLPMKDLTDAMESALIAFSNGSAFQPVRTTIEPRRPSAILWTMPARLDKESVMGAKLVAARDASIESALPVIQATIVLLDGATGALLACMDGNYITAARTAAVSALACQVLANNKTGRLAIIGSGVQARSHVEALVAVNEFKEIRCWSPNEKRLRKFVEQFSTVAAADSAEHAVAGADVVLLVTSSATPVIENAWILV